MNHANHPVVIITGATGFLGKRLTYDFINRGYEVYILTRDIKRAEAIFNKLPVKIVGAAIIDVRSLKIIPKGSRIFHCAAITGAIQASQKSYEVVNVIRTRNLLNVAIERNAVSFTFVSSVSTVGAMRSENNLITEQTVPDPKTYYGQSKLVAEKIILNLAPSTLPITIIRPPLIYGEDQTPT
jgi:nucleoside-diphosphate-sugar epimerase